jgi:uncharacterized membrane protein YeaQ/YmgE (transglycosylase-associated protein family)
MDAEKLEKSSETTVKITASESVTQQTRHYPKYSLVPAIVSAIIVVPALVYLAWRVSPGDKDYPVTYIICLCGYVLGWILAIISTPMDKSDEDKISRFTKVVGTFLTGYLLGKIDKLIETITNPSFLTTLGGIRLLLFLCCCGFTFIMVFYYREYKYN